MSLSELLVALALLTLCALLVGLGVSVERRRPGSDLAQMVARARMTAVARNERTTVFVPSTVLESTCHVEGLQLPEGVYAITAFPDGRVAAAELLGVDALAGAVRDSVCESAR